MTTLVNLWSGPRNVSTALMYAFRERADTTVVDEPLYAAWLDRNPDADHPGRAETMASQPADPAEVVARLTGDDWPTPLVFAKQMASHLDGIDRSWLGGCRNAILVRHPAPVVSSYTEQVSTPSPEALGYVVQVELVREAIARGETPVVLETTRLLRDPPGVLARACELLGIGFDEAMLSWPPGPKPEDGAWAPWWYAATHRSTGFGAPRTHDRQQLPDRFEEVVEACEPLYDEIVAHAL